jgi:hypothetical protein
LWTAYCQWRFRNAPPYETLCGEPPGPWPARLDAVLTAFALYAGEQEGSVLTVVEAFGEGMSNATPGWQA